MVDRMTREETRECLAQRADAYGFLSTVYSRETSRDMLAELRKQMAQAEAGGEGDGHAQLARFFQETSEMALDALETELAADYAGLFLAARKRNAPPYESVYTSPDRLLMQEARDQVIVEYAAEGLECGEFLKGPEDHIAIELEFMRALCGKAAEALEAQDVATAKQFTEKQRAFLDRHLQNWVPQFCADVQKNSRTGFYPAIAQITLEHLSMEPELLIELLDSF
jgi:putative dimethyl sulfoxide reductase chaperone